MGVVAVLAFAAVMVLVLMYGAQVTRRRRKFWADTAANLGFEQLGPQHIQGELDGSEVEAEIYSTGSGKNRRTYTRVMFRRDLPDDISLTREGFLSRLSDDITTGDADFDHGVRIKGDEGAALALLDAPTRAVLGRAIGGGGWTLVDGELKFNTGELLGETLETTIRQGAALATMLRAAKSSMVARLVERVRDDALPAARKRCLEYLLARYQGSGAVEKALSIALADAHGGVRFVAADALGDVRVLAGIAVDRTQPPELRGKALERVRGLGADATEVVALVAALVRELDEVGVAQPLLRELVEALGHVPHPEAEARLITFLGSDDEAVQFPAIHALGRVGSVAAVPHLLPIRERFLAFARESSSLAKEAILAIQARAGHAEAGALALAGGVEGALAVSEESEAG